MKMLWNDKILFVHVAKAGGSSIKKLFGFNHPTYNQEKEMILTEPIQGRYPHAPPPSLETGRYVIMNIRNPFAMWVSTWGWNCTPHKEDPNRGTGGYYDYLERIGKQDLVAIGDPNNVEAFRKWLNWSLDHIGGFQSQRMLQSCLGQPHKVDKWIRCEHYKEDLIDALLASGVELIDGWEERVDKIMEEKPNKREHLPYLDYFTPKLLEKTAQAERPILMIFYPNLYEELRDELSEMRK